MTRVINAGRHWSAAGQTPRTTLALTALQPRSGLTTHTTADPDGLALSTAYGYDSAGRLLTTTTPGGKTWTTVLDRLGRSVGAIDPGHLRQDLTLAPDGSPLRRDTLVAGQPWAASTTLYDSAGRPATSSLLQQTLPPTGDEQWLTTTTSYHPTTGQPIAVTDPLGRLSETLYDHHGRPVEERLPDGTLITHAYDPLGQPVARTVHLPDQPPMTTTSHYDDAGRLASVTDPTGLVTSYTYDDLGRRTSALTDGRITTWDYADAGRRVTETRSDGAAITRLYDPRGRLIAYTDHTNATTTYHYDCAGRLAGVTYPDDTQRGFLYHPDGEPAALLRADGSRVDFTIDHTGRLTSAQVALPGPATPGPPHPSAHTTFAYDPLGHLIAAATPAVSLAFTRDSLGRPVSETLTIDPGVLPGFGSRTLTRTFDPGGRPVLLTLPNGDLLQRAFTPADQLAALTLAGQPLWQADHAGTRLLQAQRGPLHLHHPTDPAGLPLGHTAAVAGLPRHHHAYAWTSDRLRETIARHDLRRTLTRLHYDQARRLASLAEQDADLSALLASPVLRSREEWDLSPHDTLPQRRRIEHGHHHPSHAVTNHLHQVTTLTHPARGTAHYHWTPDGALASRTGPDGQLLLTHDWRDRLIRAQLPDGRTIDYLLDPLGRLTARLRSDGHATVYLSDGDQVVEEYAVPPGGTTPLLQRRMVWGRWIDDLLAVIRDSDGDGVPDATLYPLTDLLGSVEVLADASGAIVEGVRSRPDGTPEAFAPALPAPAELAWTGDGETSAGQLPPNQLTLTFTAPLGEDLSRLAVELDGVPHGGTAALSPHGRTLVLSDLTLPATTTLRLGGLADRAGRALPPVEASVTLTDPQRYTVLATWEEPKVQAVLESQAGVTVVATVPVTGDELQGTITVTLNGQPLAGTVSRVAPEALHWSASDEAWQTGAEVTVSLNGLTDLSEPARTVTAGPWSFTVLADGEAILVAEDGGAVESRTASAFGVTAYFQGRMWDSDLGMYYYRARWYDPELVNFIQRDPLGYVDSSNLYQALGYNPYRYVDPAGLSVLRLDGRTTVGIMPFVMLSPLERDVNSSVVKSRLERAVATFWGEKQHRSQTVIFDIAVLELPFRTPVLSDFLAKVRSGLDWSDVFFINVGVSGIQRHGSYSTSSRLWLGASDETFAHEYGHWLNWTLAIESMDRFGEGYEMPLGSYPSDGIMGDGPGSRSVHPIDVAAVIDPPGIVRGEFMGRRISTVSRHPENRSEFDIYSGRPTIRDYLARLANALRQAGVKTKHDEVTLHHNLSNAYEKALSEKETVQRIMNVFKQAVETR